MKYQEQEKNRSMDFGIKRNILRSFKKKLSYDSFLGIQPEEIMKYNLDGLFLSNGPGDQLIFHRSNK